MPKRTLIDEIEHLVRDDSEVDTPALTILPSGKILIDEERRALNSEALEALAVVRMNATY